jgi:uncharacterized membrane protein YidH (DUF202 family)
MIDGTYDPGQPEWTLPDLGAAAERTSLAWQRSGLGMIAVGALFVRVHQGPRLLSVLLGCVLIGTGILATALVGPWRYRTILAQVSAAQSPTSRWVMALAAVVICAVACASFGVVNLG